MAAYWLNFSARSNPNGQGLPVWPAYRTNEPGHVMVLGDIPAAETEMVPSAAALEFFDAAYARHLESLTP
jgi:para-nitrobenzyl esterase